MRKILTVAICLFPLFSMAQKKTLSFYSILKGGYSTMDGVKSSPMGSIQLGIRAKNGITLGIGAAYRKFKEDYANIYGPLPYDAKYSYIPLFAEVSYIKYDKKVAPYFNLQFGKGIYSATHVQFSTPYKPGKIATEGSYFYSLGTGLFIPVAANKAILFSGQYSLSKFRNTNYIGTLTESGFESVTYKTTTSHKGFLFAIGFNMNLPAMSR